MGLAGAETKLLRQQEHTKQQRQQQQPPRQLLNLPLGEYVLG